MLPPEIWIAVFRWATYPSHGYPPSYYEPFCSLLDHTPYESLETKRALVQVCRLWWALGTTFLYEDLRIRHDLGDLKRVLAESRTDDLGHPLGNLVHHLELPYSLTPTERPGDTHDIAQILRSCPSLKTLVRPYLKQSLFSIVRYEFPAKTVSLPSLTRLEWWHYDNAARSGGINSLIDVLHNTPSLQHLTLAGEFRIVSMRFGPPLRLPALSTLRLWRVNTLFVSQIQLWELPSLVHVIVDAPVGHAGLDELWLRFGSQLCTVEFGRHLGFYMTDQISSFLRGCPSVKAFNYYINFTSPPVESQLVSQSSLERIGIHGFPCSALSDSWSFHLDSHLEFLSSLPALKCIILYGDWQHIIEDAHISPALDRLKQKGCAIQLADRLIGPLCDHS